MFKIEQIYISAVFSEIENRTNAKKFKNDRVEAIGCVFMVSVYIYIC